MARAKSSAADNQHEQATGGLAGATARGEAARVQWVVAALVAGIGMAKVESLAAAWARERGASHGARSTAAAA